MSTRLKPVQHRAKTRQLAPFRVKYRLVKQAHLGVIDTLSLGFTIVARQAWILLIPIALDFYLWWGPRLSPMPILRPALDILGLPSELRAEYLTALERLDLRELLYPTALGMPSFLARGEQLFSGSTVEIASPSVFLGAVLFLIVIGLFMAAVYWGLLAQRIRGNPSASRWPTQLLVWWARVGGFGILLFLASSLLGLPVALLLFLVAVFDQGLAALLAVLVLALSAVIWFHLFFTVGAMFMSDVGPFKAMGQSVALVRSHFGPSLVLILLITILATGLPLAFRTLSFHPWGTALGILSNAYVGSALVAASLIFYRDRLGKIPIQESVPAL